MQLPNSRYMVQQCIGGIYQRHWVHFVELQLSFFRLRRIRPPNASSFLRHWRGGALQAASEITVPLSLSKIWPSKWNWFAEDKSYWVEFVNSQIYFMHFKFDFSCSKLENCPFLCVKRGLGMFLFHILHQICNSVQTNKSLRK